MVNDKTIVQHAVLCSAYKSKYIYMCFFFPNMTKTQQTCITFLIYRDFFK